MNWVDFNRLLAQPAADHVSIIRVVDITLCGVVELTLKVALQSFQIRLFSSPFNIFALRRGIEFQDRVAAHVVLPLASAA